MHVQGILFYSGALANTINNDFKHQTVYIIPFLLHIT